MFFELISSWLALARKMQYACKTGARKSNICTVCPDNMKQAEPVRLNREQASKQAFWFPFPWKKSRPNSKLIQSNAIKSHEAHRA